MNHVTVADVQSQAFLILTTYGSVPVLDYHPIRIQGWECGPAIGVVTCIPIMWVGLGPASSSPAAAGFQACVESYAFEDSLGTNEVHLLSLSLWHKSKSIFLFDTRISAFSIQVCPAILSQEL